MIKGNCPMATLRLSKLHDPQLLEKYDLRPNGDYNQSEIEYAVENILRSVGENPLRDGLLRTPNRVARMYQELLSGYFLDPSEVINNAIFEVDYSEMVLVRDIEFYSLCEHHMLPFIGHVHVGYIPTNWVVGLSKIPRVVDMFARRLQVQERMTTQIAEFMMDMLEPLGVGVVVEGLHMCSMMRGVKKANARMVTSALMGSFRDDERTRAEFLSHVQRSLGKEV
ncbi:MAG: GTP cyclohydrolase I FolE [Anaerolineae bacterium]|nr:MAG: GTP cyclohydrolase I FolE [Anaerolineae bacterium]